MLESACKIKPTCGVKETLVGEKNLLRIFWFPHWFSGQMEGLHSWLWRNAPQSWEWQLIFWTDICEDNHNDQSNTNLQAQICRDSWDYNNHWVEWKSSVDQWKYLMTCQHEIAAAIWIPWYWLLVLGDGCWRCCSMYYNRCDVLIYYTRNIYLTFYTVPF